MDDELRQAAKDAWCRGRYGDSAPEVTAFLAGYDAALAEQSPEDGPRLVTRMGHSIPLSHEQAQAALDVIDRIDRAEQPLADVFGRAADARIGLRRTDAQRRRDEESA